NIVRALYENGSLGYRELKRTIESPKYLDRVDNLIAWDTYGKCIDELIKYGIIQPNPSKEKQRHSLFKKTPLSLSERGKKIYSLGLSIISKANIVNTATKAEELSKEEVRLKRYNLLLSCIVFPPRYNHKISNEKQLEQLLSRIGFSKNNLQVDDEYTQEYNIDKTGAKEYHKRIWFKPLSGIKFRKDEYIRNDIKPQILYYYELPGISKSEFIKIQPHGNVEIANIHKEITYSPLEAEEDFRKLEENTIIAPLDIPSVRTFKGETRYDITDETLKEFIRDYYILFGEIDNRIRYDIRYLHQPSPILRKFYSIFYDPTFIDSYFIESVAERKRLEYDVNEEEKIYRKKNAHRITSQFDEGSIKIRFEQLKKKYASTIIKYDYLLVELLDQIECIIKDSDRKRKKMNVSLSYY
ncbi:MAG: hypothetical protein ACJ71P_20925, partial [Nitrososphaeraceae archaeon]